MIAKTSYRRRRTELIVRRLEAKQKEVDKAELKAERKEVESSIKVKVEILDS